MATLFNFGSLLITFVIVAVSVSSAVIASDFWTARSFPGLYSAWIALIPSAYSFWTDIIFGAWIILSIAFCFWASTAETCWLLIKSLRLGSLLICPLIISASSVINCSAYFFRSPKVTGSVTYWASILVIPLLSASLTSWAFKALLIFSLAVLPSSSTAVDCLALVCSSSDESFSILFFTFLISWSISALALLFCPSKEVKLDS